MIALMHGMLAAANQFSDPHWANVVSLLRFQGADGASTFPDDKGRAWTRSSGGAEIDTAQSRFGSSSLLLASGASLTTASTLDFALATDSWTIEYAIRPTSLAVYPTVLDLRSGNTDVNYADYLDPAGKLRLYWGEADRYVSAGIVPLNAWTDVAVVRDGTTFRVFLNGNLDGTFSWSGTLATAARPARLGNNLNQNAGLPGHIGGLRITKGVARYAVSYTPSAFPAS